MKIFKKFFVTFMTSTLLLQSIPLYAVGDDFVRGKEVARKLRRKLIPILDENMRPSGEKIKFSVLVDKFSYDAQRIINNIRTQLDKDINLSIKVRYLGEEILEEMKHLKEESKNLLLPIRNSPAPSPEAFCELIQKLGNLEYKKNKFIKLAKRETKTSFVVIAELTDALTLLTSIGLVYVGMSNAPTSYLLRLAHSFGVPEFSFGKLLHDKLLSLAGSVAFKDAAVIDGTINTIARNLADNVVYPIGRTMPFVVASAPMMWRNFTFNNRPTVLGAFIGHNFLNRTMRTPFVTEAPASFRNTFIAEAAHFYNEQNATDNQENNEDIGLRYAEAMMNPVNPQVHATQIQRAGWGQSSLRTAIRFSAMAVSIVAIVYVVKALGKSTSLGTMASPVTDAVAGALPVVEMVTPIVESYFAGLSSFEFE